MINKDRLVRLTQAIIRINSENPPGNEYQLAQLVKRKLRSYGFQVKSIEFAKRRPNIIGVLKGKSRKGAVLFSPHLDTVPAGGGWKINPFSGRIINGKIFGRGATDCKGNLAVGLEVMQSLTEEKISLSRDIIFAATADEEAGSGLGIVPLIKKGILKPSAAIILDSDEFNIIIAQKGLIHFKIRIFGKKAHGAYPDLGINAIEIAAKVIDDLKNYQFKFRKHTLLKAPTINIGTIKGGDKVNMVADFCEFEIDLRFLPGMNAADILRQIKALVSKRAKKFKIVIDGIQEPCEINKDNSLVKTLLLANRRFHKKAKLEGSEGATVISFFLQKGISAVATGFGMEGQAHVTDERVRVDDLYKGALALEEFIKEFDSVK
ncbi:MAG: ArgE/DapE family deacylase [Candidatus Omnitrophota bacterium]|nr:ArgE/DapE family deacylase [Candidatus Omnitrophota bacterium]